MAFDISAYNVQGYIHKLENLQQYEFPFERLRRVEEQYLGKKVKKMGEDGKEIEVRQTSDDEEEEEKKKQEDADKLEDIKEDKEGEDDEAGDAAAQEKQEPLDLNDPKALLKKLEQKPTNTINLDEVDAEVQRLETASTAASETQSRCLLDGFVQSNVKFHLISGNLEKMYDKKKYRHFFDIGVLSVNSANQITKDLSVLFKDKARVHCETADYMVILKQDQREEFRKKIIEKVRDARWTVSQEKPCFSHHMLLQVHHVDY